MISTTKKREQIKGGVEFRQTKSVKEDVGFLHYYISQIKSAQKHKLNLLTLK